MNTISAIFTIYTNDYSLDELIDIYNFPFDEKWKKWSNIILQNNPSISSNLKREHNSLILKKTSGNSIDMSTALIPLIEKLKKNKSVIKEYSWKINYELWIKIYSNVEPVINIDYKSLKFLWDIQCSLDIDQYIVKDDFM